MPVFPAHPNVNAGPGQNAEALTLVTLNGSASSDPDNGPNPLTFNWTFAETPAGSTATLMNATTAKPSFTPDFTGIYRVTLDAFDGAATDQGEVQITVTVPNVPPNAAAGRDRVVELGPPAETATLNGAGSNDPDNGPVTPLMFQCFVSVAPGSGLTNSSVTKANTDTPNVIPDVPGDYVLQLEASDGADTDNDQVMVKANAAPVAVDYPSYSTEEDTPFTGSSVLANDTDANNDPLTAVLVSGQPVNAQSFAFNPDGTFSYTPNADFFGTDTFTYKANDDRVDSHLATVTITVNLVTTRPWPWTMPPTASMRTTH